MFVIWALDTFGDHTTCYARVETEAAADRLEAAADEHGFSVETADRPGFHLTFESSDTGEDADAFRDSFKAAVEREGGRLGHPGDGCTVKSLGD